MSNIYYKDKKASEDSKWTFVSDVLNLDNVHKVLASKITGLGLTEALIPLPNTSWRKEELFFDHADFGKIYIPINIHFTNGTKDYFIVLIDDKLEIRRWPGFSSASKNIDEKIDHTAIVEEVEFRDVERSFKAVVDHLGFNKPYEERYKSVRGVTVKKESLGRFVKLICDDPGGQDITTEKVHKAAINPVAYFKENMDYFQAFFVSEPSKELWLSVLVQELKSAKVLFELDWKASIADINFALSELSRHQFKQILTADEEQGQTRKLLAKADKKLQTQGFFLLTILAGSDSFPVFLIKNEKKDELLTCARQCKIKVSGF